MPSDLLPALERQLLELECLRSMYPSECSVDAAAESQARALVDGALPLNTSRSLLSVAVSVAVGECGEVATLHCTLPTVYPETEPPALELSCAGLTPAAHAAVSAALCHAANEAVADGREALSDLCLVLQQEASAAVQQQQQQQQ
mmetsp:Transcript_26879/g.86229  ORF Transcript_26879/g.86229 Transcript_26879/m.86229 type:complete len:145 (-) Transcript_26879:1-435(-)